MTTSILKSKQVDIFQIVGIFSLCLLLGLLAAFFHPIVFESHAEEQGALASTIVRAVASISADASVTLDITPSDEGKFESKPINVNVTTNTGAGYKLVMSSIDDDTAMTSVNTTSTIASTFAGAVTSSTMPVNSWGYSLNNINFLKVPKKSEPVTLKDTDTSVANGTERTTIYVGAKVNTNIPASTYSKSLLFTAVAYQPPATFYDITYMHELNSTVCSNTPTAKNKSITATTPNNTLAEAATGNYIAQTTLKDYRDGKTYLVRKYANGECWMAQNLELDFKTSSNGYATNTTTATTTINDEWIKYSDIEDTTTFNASTNAYKAGKFYATQSVPTVQNTNNSTYAWADNGQDGAHSFSTAAAGSNFQNYVVKTGSTAGDGYFTFQETATGQPYQRYGNYYNWAAATAGFLGTATGEQNNSICPRNWQLPTNSGSKSFKNLIDYYYTDTYTAGANNTKLYNWLNGAPLDFWRAGYYYRSYGSVINRTTNGYWWSRNASSATYANSLGTYLYSGTGYVYPQYSYYRGHGFSVRCVVR